MQTSYDDIQRLLIEERSLTDAAEAHGTLAGSLCTTTRYPFEDWLREILPEGLAGPESVTVLRDLYAGTAQALEGENMEFEPLLPEDEESIAARTIALAQWCRGFLYGLSSQPIPDASTIPEEVGEVVRDLSDITSADVDSAESDEENESAYTELVEFVRVGVQLVFDGLEPLRAQENPPLH